VTSGGREGGGRDADKTGELMGDVFGCTVYHTWKNNGLVICRGGNTSRDVPPNLSQSLPISACNMQIGTVLYSGAE